MNQIISGIAPHALVVDDDALILMETASILVDAGFQVLEAMNVAQALRLLDEHQGEVQLLFTDVQMPGAENGFALARQAAQRWPHISIVVASGERQPGPSDLPDGATFIGKPFSRATVRRFVRETMPSHRHPDLLKH